MALKISNELQKSGSVNYAYPNWMRVRTKRSIPDDTLFANQWHLLNTGQGGGQSGEDVNIVSVWDTYRGSANEIIALVDDGLEINHPDLRDNVRTDLCWDFVNNNSDTTDGEHGTSCAGVAAGRGFNSLGICGAAPNARLVGHRITFDTFLPDTVWASALSRNNDVIDIYSNSWGPGDGGYYLDGLSPLIRDALANTISTGRAGRGNIYLWAGGNGGDIDNSNYDGFSNSRYAIAVAASTNNGMHALLLRKRRKHPGKRAIQRRHPVHHHYGPHGFRPVITQVIIPRRLGAPPLQHPLWQALLPSCSRQTRNSHGET